jgi:Clp amino terminal domain, pathogenicity island component
MFERYTEKARRVIFFARYEAARYGLPEIDTEHLLLGLMREYKELLKWLPKTDPQSIRERIDACSPKPPPLPSEGDLPLSSGGKRVLKFAADEADRLAHRHIGTEHLFLGLLDEEAGFAAQVLRDGGADAGEIRARIANSPVLEGESSVGEMRRKASRLDPRAGAIEIHGVRRNTEYVREAVQQCRMYNWHWHQCAWTNVDVVIEKKTGEVSFDLSLAQDPGNFEVVKGGWKRDHCIVCRWELFESQGDKDAEHATGYTNGHIWLRTECYTKFWQRPDFFASPYSDIT